MRVVVVEDDDTNRHHVIRAIGKPSSFHVGKSAKNLEDGLYKARDRKAVMSK